MEERNCLFSTPYFEPLFLHIKFYIKHKGKKSFEHKNVVNKIKQNNLVFEDSKNEKSFKKKIK